MLLLYDVSVILDASFAPNAARLASIASVSMSSTVGADPPPGAAVSQ